MTESSSPLRTNIDFWKLWSGQTLSAFGGTLSGVAYPLLTLAITRSATKTSVVALAFTLPFAICQLPAGVLVDRMGRRRLMLLCDLGRGTAMLVLGILVALNRVDLIALLGAALVEGILSVPFSLAQVSALPDLVGEERLASALSLNQGRAYGMSLAAQPVAGLLYSLSTTVPFIADAASYALSVLTLAAIRRPLGPSRQRTNRSIGHDISAALRWTWNHRFVRTTALLSVGSDMVINALFLLVIIIARQHGASSTDIGIMLALGASGGALGAVLAPVIAKHVKSLRLVAAGAVWIGVPSVAAMALTANPLALGALEGVTLLSWPTYNATVGAAQLCAIPENIRGSVQSAITTFGWAPVPVAPVLAVIMMEHAGSGATMLVLAGVMAAVALAASLARSIDGSASGVFASDNTQSPKDSNTNESNTKESNTKESEVDSMTADPSDVHFEVVVNQLGQYSIWPATTPIPPGWDRVGFTGTKEDCCSHIDCVWSGFLEHPVSQISRPWTPEE